MVVLLLVGMLASPALLQKFVDFNEHDPYNYMRTKVWASTLAMIGNHPMFGVGLGDYAHASKPFTPAAEGAISRYRSRMGIAHSEYLQYAAEIGLPAALLLFGVMGYLFRQAQRNASHSSDDSRPAQEAAVLTAAAICGHAVIDNNWTTPVMAAGLVAFSMADSLPVRKWEFRFAVHRRALAAAGFSMGLMLYLHSTFIPWLGLFFIHSGHRAQLAGNLEAAESLQRMATAVSPDHSGFLDMTGMLYLKMYRTTRDQKYLDFADHFLQAASNADPKADEPRRHIEQALMARLTGNSKDDRPIHLRLVEADREVLRVDPFDPFVRKNLAEALYQSGSRSEAERELLNAIEIEPNFVPAYTRLAEWYSEEGDLTRSAEFKERWCRPNDMTHCCSAGRIRRSGRRRLATDEAQTDHHAVGFCRDVFRHPDAS
jgi:tetratricopeptide (TPR) repeat protein